MECRFPRLLCIASCLCFSAACGEEGAADTEAGATGTGGTSGQAADETTANPTTAPTGQATSGDESSDGGVDDSGVATTDTSGSTGACDDVDCGNGTCEEDNGAATCACDEGFHAEGPTCILDVCKGEDCPMTVAELQTLYDEIWAGEQGEQCMELSTSTGIGQEHYYLSYCIDGLTSMWRATGDLGYLDTALELIGNTLADTVTDGDGYRRWPAEGGVDEGYPLWETYYWRHVMTIVRVLADHPELRAQGDYQARYDELLEFSRVHIWEKWRVDGIGNFYRSQTHMAAHPARIGLDLYALTGEAEYLEVFEDISFDGMPSRDDANLADQLEPNPDAPGALVWSRSWPPDYAIQDVSHAGAIVSFWAHAYDDAMYWDAAHIDALVTTLLDVVWDPALNGSYARNVDGTSTELDGSPSQPHGPDGTHGRMHEWLVLGRYDERVQQRIEDVYLDPDQEDLRFFGHQAVGIAAHNARLLAYGDSVY